MAECEKEGCTNQKGHKVFFRDPTETVEYCLECAIWAYKMDNANKIKEL